jgi:RNA polymerase sigma factor (TIGR02999 family)
MASRSDHEIEPREILPVVYAQLRRLAGHYLGANRAGASLTPTDLVHEAYLRLADADHIDWRGKTHFLAVAATQMRRLLVDRARRAAAAKRGGRPTRVTLRGHHGAASSRAVEVLALDRALVRLAERSVRQARGAELRLFAGTSTGETADILGVSERTVKQDWKLTRAWLAKELRARYVAPGE